MERDRLIWMMETAMMATLAYALSYVQFSGFWAQGGSVSLVMIPIILLSFRRGIKAGITAGLIVGLLKAMIGGYLVHPVQIVLDYPVAYAAIGLAGLFSLTNKSKSARIASAVAGIAIGAIVRLLSHFVSGVVWFGEYAPEGMPVALYSFFYNLSYLLPEVLITSVILIIIISTRYSLVDPKTA